MGEEARKGKPRSSKSQGTPGWQVGSSGSLFFTGAPVTVTTLINQTLPGLFYLSLRCLVPTCQLKEGVV